MTLLLGAILSSVALSTIPAVGEARPGGQEPTGQPSSANAVSYTAQRAGRCRRLRGRDLAPARSVKVVRRQHTNNGTDLLGCVLPRGRVRRIASSEKAGNTVATYRLRQVRGAILLVASSYSSQYAATSTTSVWNLRSGRSYTIAERCSSLATGVCKPDEDATSTAAFINRRGQAAAAITPTASNETAIVGFSSRGERRRLDFGPSDQVPATSLRLTGSVVSWTHSGVTRSATLAG